MLPSDLIADPKHWTKGTFARDEAGLACFVANGVSFCMMGALQACGKYNVDVMEELRAAIFKLPIEKRLTFDECHLLGEWNDSAEHEDVIAVLKSVGL